MNGHTNPWSAAALTRLRVLWLNGESAAQIVSLLRAEELGAFTRNAVLGKVWRLGLGRHGRVVLKHRRPAPQARPRVVRQRKTCEKKPRLPTADCRLPTAEHLPPLLDAAGQPVAPHLLALVAGQCRYPTGDPRGDAFAFCARPVAPDPNNGGVPYCAGHQRLTRVAGSGSKPKRARAA